MPQAKIHRDKPMSRETAELLGLAFTWGGGVVAFKYVRTDEGLRVCSREIEPNLFVDCDTWTRFPIRSLDEILPNEAPLVLVTFSDDAQMLEQRW